MRIAHISDLHIIAAPPGPGLVRPDAVARARALIADLMRPDLQIDHVVITGDNVNDARPDEYALLRDVLSGLSIPFTIIPGNHDDRAELRASFPAQPYVEADFLYHECQIGHERQIGTVRLLALDSLSPGRTGGTLDAAQLAWLAARLAAPCSGQTMIALHHPPAPTGMGVLDRNILTEGANDFLALLEGAAQPILVLCGHMHRPFVLHRGQVLISAAASTAFQFAFRPDDPAEPPASDEPFHYTIHLIAEDGSQAIHRRFPDL